MTWLYERMVSIRVGNGVLYSNTVHAGVRWHMPACIFIVCKKYQQQMNVMIFLMFLLSITDIFPTSFAISPPSHHVPLPSFHLHYICHYIDFNHWFLSFPGFLTLILVLQVKVSARIRPARLLTQLFSTNTLLLQCILKRGILWDIPETYYPPSIPYEHVVNSPVSTLKFG